VEVLSLCPFRAGALAWQSAPNAWSLTVVVKATFSIVPGGEATLAPVQAPVAAFAGDSEASTEDLSPLKPRVDVLVLRGRNDDSATVEIASSVVPGRGPMPPYAPMRRMLLQDQGLEWAAAVLRGEAAAAGPAPEGFDFSFFHSAPREQRIDLLRTGIPLVLNNVLLNQARVETILPQRKPQAFRIHPQTGKASEIILRCDTLCIDAARNLLILTFRGLADIDAGGIASAGTIVVAAHSGGKKIRADRIERFLRNGEPIEGESNDGRHPLEKRYDTVLAAPKGDTVALPELEGSGGWPAAGTIQNETTAPLAGATPGLPFQTTPSDAPPPLIPPAPLKSPSGGRRHGTLSLADAQRSPDMPFQGQLPPPAAEEYRPPPPPEGVFPAPPALLGFAPPPEHKPLIRPPAMLGSSFTQDEKTADLPPGRAPAEENLDDATVDLPPQVAAAVRPADVAPPVVEEPVKKAPAAPSLAGKPINAPKAPIAAPSAPKPIGVIGAPKAPAPAAPKPAAPVASAPKPAPVATAAPKAAIPAPIAPKPIAPKGPIKVPAPLGPKLKTDAPVKPAGITPAIEKKPLVPAAVKPAITTPAKSPSAAPEKPAFVALEKPAMLTPEKPAMMAPVKPAMIAPQEASEPAKPAHMRPMTPTVLFPSKIGPEVVPPVAAGGVAAAGTETFDASAALKLQECAALEAELRHRPANRKTLLEKNQLSDEQWLAVHKHWTEAIARETEVGERKLLMAYDAAYFAVQERLGINVGLETHAKLQVATERGTSAEVLKECGLEPTDQMRLGRVWTQRLADEPARMRELALAIEKARAG